MFYSCSERMICPAYQSAFIHDQSTLDRHFSYFGEDSLPKNMLTASKDKFLLIEKQPYKKKLRSFNTVPMKTIYPVLDDSLALVGDVKMLAEMDVVDSVALDSVVQNEYPWKEKFNVDQEFYFHYFNDILVYPSERAQAEMSRREKRKRSKASGEKQKFFKRIFGKKKDKKKEAKLSDEDESLDDKSSKKKGLFGNKKKNKEEKIDTDEEQTDSDVPATEEDDDDEDDDF
ncbi:MAG: hypothetical protein OEX22_05730 [Cyclobacteriaceae bacterium]|nr:hypothetical protein [Cyclobacteriaceae bacterium]